MRVVLFLTMLALVGLIGCAPEKSPVKGDAAKKKDDDHDHGEGPHKGTVTDWANGKYHVEFCVDHGKKQATVYVLDGDAKKDAPIKADELTLKIKEPAFELKLKAQRQEKDPEGKCSRFVGTHKALGKEQEFEGEIIGNVDGKDYKGTFKEEPPKK